MIVKPNDALINSLSDGLLSSDGMNALSNFTGDSIQSTISFINSFTSMTDSQSSEVDIIIY